MKLILGYFLFVQSAILCKANSEPNCEDFIGQLLAYGVPKLCAVPGVCDAHCTCIHNATCGKCIDYPKVNVYVPHPTPSQMCTCDYSKPRPKEMQLVTRETCEKVLEALPVYSELFPLLCSVFCSYDCVCSHGFQSGVCKGPYCICTGIGPSITPTH